MPSPIDTCLHEAATDLGLAPDAWRSAPIEPVLDVHFFQHRDRPSLLLQIRAAERSWSCLQLPAISGASNCRPSSHAIWLCIDQVYDEAFVTAHRTFEGARSAAREAVLIGPGDGRSRSAPKDLECIDQIATWSAVRRGHRADYEGGSVTVTATQLAS